MQLAYLAKNSNSRTGTRMIGNVISRNIPQETPKSGVSMQFQAKT